MSFQILDKNNNPIPINSLDKEAAEFWGFKTDNPKLYAMPESRDKFPEGWKGSFEFNSQSNWYDSIGWAISFKKCTTWRQVKDYLLEAWQEYLLEYPEATEEECLGAKGRLIDHWESKGYTPKCVD